MKSLYLLRHADAAAPERGKTDMDRHLNERGVQACEMIIGHNPGLQMLALGLSESQNGNAYRETAVNFPAGGLAKLAVHPELGEDVEPGKFTYLKLMTP